MLRIKNLSQTRYENLTLLSFIDELSSFTRCKLIFIGLLNAKRLKASFYILSRCSLIFVQSNLLPMVSGLIINANQSQISTKIKIKELPEPFSSLYYSVNFKVVFNEDAITVTSLKFSALSEKSHYYKVLIFY